MKPTATFSFALFLLSFASMATAQMGNIDTKHVSDKSFCVVRLDVKRTVSHLKSSRKNFERMGKEFTEDSGLDLSKLNALTIQFGDSDVDEGNPCFAVTFEFSEKIDREKFLKEAFGRMAFENEKINGKTFLKPDSDNKPHIYFESDSKFTMATPGAIKNVLMAGGGMGQMSSSIKSAPPGAEIIAVFQKSEGFVGSIEEFRRELKDLPIPLKLYELVAKGESGFAYVNLESSNPIYLNLNLQDGESAKEFQTGLNLSLAMAKAALPAAQASVKKQLKTLDGTKGIGAMQKRLMEMAQTGLNIASKILTGLNVTSKEKTIEIKVRHMGGFTEVADVLVDATMTFIFGLGRSVSDGPAIAEPDLAPTKKATKK